MWNVSLVFRDGLQSKLFYKHYVDQARLAAAAHRFAAFPLRCMVLRGSIGQCSRTPCFWWLWWLVTCPLDHPVLRGLGKRDFWVRL